MDLAVHAEGLRKRYGAVDAVRDMTFDVHVGEIFGLLGPNGAGKTTTVEILQGLRRADAGHVRVLGLDPATEVRQLRRRIGSQLQESALPARMKVREALSLFCGLSARPVDTGRLLEEWGLADRQDAAFADLSGGQRQRLFIALALVSDPEAVFLDEMTTGLDPAARRVAWDLIRRVRASGTTVVLVTHFMDEAERLCDRVAVVRDGTIVAEGAPQALVNRVTPEMRLRFSVPRDADLAWLDRIGSVRSVERWAERVEIEGVDPVLAEVSAGLLTRGLRPADLRVEQPTLEDAFLRLTEEGSG